MKYLLSSLLIAIATTALSACNTIKGVGQDVSAGGRDLTKAAGAVERKIQN
jgi:entericidin B